MTTRAGSAGILTGLITTLIIYLLFIAHPDAFLQRWSADTAGPIWITAAVLVILFIAGGWSAGWWSGSVRPWRRAVLGGLAGGLAGIILFCLWGAATAGSVRFASPLDYATNGFVSQIEVFNVIIRQTLEAFLVLFLGGGGLGALGGWLAGLGRGDREDVFDKAKPQMAMNASITAVPASIVAAVLATGIFSRLSDLLDNQPGQPILDGTIMTMPLAVSLLLVLISHFALTLVIPHEAQQAEHLCGMDEVKMAAYVGIGAAPLLILLLLLVNPDSFTTPLVLIALLASTAMSLKSLHTLFKQILPRRASFPPPQPGRQKREAIWFGTIAKSPASRLVVLCIGCGLVMVLPLYVSVLSVLINLNHTLVSSPFSHPLPEVSWGLFMTQALVITGAVATSIVLLVTIYLFYLNLGRWFNKQNLHHKQA
jgi:MFS family permease